MRSIPLFAWIVLSAVPAAAVSLVAEAPCGVFTEGAQPAFRVEGTAAGTWRVTDWRGVAVLQGALAGARVAFAVPDRGYYELAVTTAAGEKTAQGFAVVPDPATRAFPTNSFFAIDAALSAVCRPGQFDCPWNKGDTFRTAADAIRLAGFPLVRDRLSWRASQPARDAVPTYGHCLENARYLHARGIRVSGLYHDAPDWAGRLVKLPGDLVAAYRFARASAEAFGASAADWEFWNEEDISFAPEPAWDFAAAHKAAALGFRAGNPQALVLPGALCCPRRTTYDALLFANDLGKYMDVFNFHSYMPLEQMPEAFGELRAFLAQVGLPDQAIWVTENGTNMEGESTEDGARKGIKKHSREQELLLAEFYPKAQACLRKEGVSRNFHFVFGAYNERDNTKDWGVLRRDGTVKPIYAAMSTMLDELGTAEQEGEVNLGAGVRGFLYRLPDGSRTLLAWRLSPLDTSRARVTDFSAPVTTCRLPLPAGTYESTDLCGRRTRRTAGADGLTLALTRHPVYLRKVQGLKVAWPTRSLGRFGPQDAAGADLSTIVRADFDRRDFTVGNGKALAELEKEEGRLRVQVWNLSDTPKQGALTVTGGVLTGLPSTVIVPAWASAEFDALYRSDTNLPPGVALLEIKGSFDGRPITRFAAPVSDLTRARRECVSTLLAADDPAHWSRNASASEYACRRDPAEKAVRFDLAWSDSRADRWFYPYYRLQPGEMPAGAQVLEFEVKSSQNKVENDYRYNYVFLAFGPDGKAGQDQIAYPAPKEQWERRTIDLRSAVLKAGGAPLTSIRIGGNPCGTKVAFWIRNMRILSARQTAK